MKLPLKLGAALLLTSAAALAIPPGNPNSPVSGAAADSSPSANDGRAPHHGDARGRHHHARLPILRELRGLDLSSAQRDSVKQLLEQNHDARRALLERRLQLMRGFATLDPTTPNYAAQSDQLAEQAATLARDHVRFEAGLTRQIVAVLTPAQTQALQTQLNQRRQSPPAHERI